MTPAIQDLMRQHERLCDDFRRDLLAGDLDAAMARTDPAFCLVNLPMRTGAEGRDAVRRFLAEQLLPHLPAGLTVRRLSRTVDRVRLVEELLVGFEHDRELPWLLPGVPATHRRTEALAITVVVLRQGRLTSRRTLWDQVQLRSGLGLPIGGDAR